MGTAPSKTYGLFSDYNLGETTTSQIAKSKEARVTELEAILGSIAKSEEETIETQNLRSSTVDQLTLLEQQTTLASEQVQMVHVLGDVEAKAVELKTQTKKLENYCEDLASTAKKLKLQRKMSLDHAKLVPT
ncbi:hypothetical protein KY289_001242 [Solanum tuberosum]|nr:hypothetical protein KY289_001242 [Solanum tuberosum]